MTTLVSRIGITPVGSAHYRLNRLRLHILAYSLMRQQQLAGHDGKFIARCDDTNENNVNRDYLDSYLTTLKKIGVHFDKTPYDKDSQGYSLFQSKRGEIYSMKLGELDTKGLLRRDGTGAAFFDTEAFSRLYSKNLNNHIIQIQDLTLGKLLIDIKSSKQDKEGLNFEPFAVQRSDGSYLFNLTSPVDDGMTGITHVVRDRDKLNTVARQEMVRIALDFPPVNYLHAPLMVNDEGKRFVTDSVLGEATYENLQEKGFSSAGIISYLLSSISGDPDTFYSSIDSFASKADFTKLHTSATRFSLEVLRIHQSSAIREMDDMTYRAELLKRAKNRNPSYADRLASDSELIDMYTKKRTILNDLTEFQSFDVDEYDAVNGDEETVKNAQALYRLFKDQLTIQTFGSLLSDAEKYQKILNFDKKTYFSALRMVLTGKTSGPSLSEILSYYQSKGVLEERMERFELQINGGKTKKHDFGKFI